MTADVERLEDLALDLVAEAANDRDDDRLADPGCPASRLIASDALSEA
jgi:hypothetical protein